MLVTLNDILPDANRDGYAVPCFNCFGYEDSIAVVRTAERLQKSVILAVNKDMVDYMPMISIFGFMRPIAEKASVPVVLHLDHAYETDMAYQAVDLGATSVMYDGSQLSLQDNIDTTHKVVEYAHKHSVSVEGEVGSVPYMEGRDYIKHILTDPADAQQFCTQSGVDAVAVSVGNIHKRLQADCTVDYNLLSHIQSAVSVPLVIHGASGIAPDDLQYMATHTQVAKFNIGTILRQTFGDSLRTAMEAYPDQFDRLFFMQQTLAPLQAQIHNIFNILSQKGQTR